MTLSTKISTFELSKPLYFIWLLREDIRGDHTLDDIEAQKDFLIWWLQHGEKEYPDIEPFNNDLKLVLFEPLKEYPQHGFFGVSRLLRYVYSIRVDMRARFKLNNKADVLAFNQWFYLHGLREHKLLHLLSPQTLWHLNQPLEEFWSEKSPSKNLPLLSPLLFFTYATDPSLKKLFDLNTLADREKFLAWFFLNGVNILKIQPLIHNDWVDWLNEPISIALQNVTLSRLGYLAWQSREDLQQNFDIKTLLGVAALKHWMESTLANETSCQWVHKKLVQQQEQYGVNLIGFAFGELGIGEDVRMAAAACDAVGIPYKVVNITPGESVREGDRILEKAIIKQTEDLPYNVNIFCLTGFDNVRVYLEQGTPLFNQRYNIGWWPWELPVWPSQWLKAFDVVDEVWAAASYTQTMYQKVTDKPVTLMPLPVNVDRKITVSRAKMGLPEKPLLFLYVFDFNSYLERKNPQAAINAFLKAFPKDNVKVGLVLKTMNTDAENPQWQAFKRLCSNDSRIILLEETLDRGEVLGLIDCCDVYLSLHRAEGFGRTPAEAMLFGKPVIATDFSGTTDFITPQTALPVQWSKKKVKVGEYPFIIDDDDAYWAEIDIDHAAQRMQFALKVAHNQAMQVKTQQFAQQQFSVTRIGNLIKKRLKAIQNSNKADPTPTLF
ncbi:MAG: glycosyltransferase family 4 protein [Methylococcales bacterium]|nr:glycosyltransferase family 4 protein [Methylococcales bacterium]